MGVNERVQTRVQGTVCEQVCMGPVRAEAGKCAEERVSMGPVGSHPGAVEGPQAVERWRNAMLLESSCLWLQRADKSEQVSTKAGRPLRRPRQ